MRLHAVKRMAVVYEEPRSSLSSPPASSQASAQRLDGDRGAPAGVPGDLRTGGEGLEVPREADPDVDELAARAGDRHVVGFEIGVGVDEGLLDRLGSESLNLARGLEHRGNVKLLAH